MKKRDTSSIWADLEKARANFAASRSADDADVIRALILEMKSAEETELRADKAQAAAVQATF